MEESIFDVSNSGKKRKTRYSRKGCLQCKRSHLKCDEGQPKCGKCVKRNISCTYQLSLVFQDVSQSKLKSMPVIHSIMDSNDGMIKEIPSQPIGSQPRKKSSTSSTSSSQSLTHTLQIQPHPQPHPQIRPQVHQQVHQQAHSQAHPLTQPQGQPLIPTQLPLLLPQLPQLSQQQQPQQQPQQPPQRQHEHLQLLSNMQQQQQQLSPQQADSLHWNVKPDFAQLLDLNDFNLQNLIYVSPSDANLLSLPNLNTKPNASATELKNWVPLLKPYDINWRNFVWIDMLQLLEKEDPFQTAYKSVNPIAISEIRIDDPNLTNFIWRFACTTLIAGNFLLFPHDRFDTFMRCLWSLNEKHTIVQDAIRYDISVFMQDVYENANLHHFSQIWDRYVRALSFKQVLGTINERIQNSQDFVEYVCLTFTVFLMFFANSALRSNLWRTHLRGCQQLLIRASILMPKGQLTALEQNAADIYSVLRDWFCHAETAASIASNFGISLIDITEFTKTAFLTESSPLSLTGNSFNLLKGMSNNLNSVYFHLLLRMFEFKDKGIDISGLNIFLFKVNGTTKSVLPQLSMFGRELLDELQRSAVLDSNLELNLIDVTDLRLKFSMLASHSMFYFLMEVYLKVYFLDVDPKSPEIKNILYTMVKTSYSNPYYSSCGVCCHPSLFVGALTCIIAEDDVLYFHFIDLLSKIADSGMAVAKNSVDKLNAIKANVAIGAYQNIINPDHDFIPI